jgi:hypothetical protein
MTLKAKVVPQTVKALCPARRLVAGVRPFDELGGATPGARSG